ncbi:transcription factor HHO3-like protein [Tanacetum coccineum]
MLAPAVEDSIWEQDDDSEEDQEEDGDDGDTFDMLEDVDGLDGTKRGYQGLCLEMCKDFIDAVLKLGGAQEATPKKIQEHMKHDDINLSSIQNHLKIFRRKTKLVDDFIDNKQLPSIVDIQGWLRRKTFIGCAVTGSTLINRGLIQAILTSLPPQLIGEATKAFNLQRIPPGVQGISHFTYFLYLIVQIRILNYGRSRRRYSHHGTILR